MMLIAVGAVRGVGPRPGLSRDCRPTRGMASKFGEISQFDSTERRGGWSVHERELDVDHLVSYLLHTWVVAHRGG